MQPDATTQPGAETAVEAVNTEVAVQHEQQASQEGASTEKEGAAVEKQPEQSTAPTPHELDWAKENPLAMKALEAIKAGDLKNFAKMVAVDYDAMSAEDLFRIKLKEDNPNLADSTIEKMLGKKMSEYDLGKFDEDGSGAKELMEADAKKMRDALKERQLAYAPPTSSANPQDQQQTEADAANFKKADDLMRSHPAYTGFETNRNLKLGAGEDAMDFAAPANLTKDDIMDVGSLLGPLWSKGENGPEGFDMERWIKINSYAKDPVAFETALINYGKMLGSKAEFTARHNPGDRPSGSVPVQGEGQNWVAQRV